MKIVIEYDGKRYVSKATDEKVDKEAADSLYAQLSEMEKIQVELEDGGWLLMQRDALRRAVILILP